MAFIFVTFTGFTMDKMPLDERIRKALLNNRNKMKSTRVNEVFNFAKDNDIRGVTKKRIREYIKDIDATTKFNGRAASKHFVFNYLGGWFADIGFNRNKAMGEKIDGENWLKQFVLFVNGNSGWAKVYEAPSKSKEVVTSIVKRFIHDMKDYPVKRIITDNDGAFDDRALPIHKIQSEISNNESEEHTNHRLFSRIDTFMSHLRKYAWHEYNVGTVNGQRAKIADQPSTKEFYIPFDTIQRFVSEWNNHVIPIVRCTRNQMMEDKNLELAYMCWALYGNKAIDKIREVIPTFDKVQLKSRTRFGDLNANRQERANGVRAGVYVIKGTQDGHYVGVDRNDRVVHFNANEIANTYDDAALTTEQMDLEDVEDVINNDDSWQGMISRYEEPQPVVKPQGVKRIYVQPQKPKKEEPKKEPSKEEIANVMAIQEGQEELARGLPPPLSKEEIYHNAQKYLKELEKIDPMRYSVMINELINRPRTVRKSTYRRVAQNMNIQAARGTPYLEQEIPYDSAYRSGQMVKLRNQLRQRNGYRSN